MYVRHCDVAMVQVSVPVEPALALLAVAASKLSLDHNLPMADSIILATAREFDATIWTQDSDFKDFQGVKYFPKK